VSEIVFDNTNFTNITFEESILQKYDIVVFETPFRRTNFMHLGIFVGDYELDKSPMILHSSYHNSGVKYESLKNIISYKTPKYKKIRFKPSYIKRPNR
jgi:hypothetical protein